MAYVAAFRAYYWNDDVAELARRFFAACPGGRQVVVADETRGKLPIPRYEVVSHTADLSSLGLPDHPQGSSLWYNVDFALYVLRRALPGFDYYVTAESDVAVNLDVEPMLAAAAARRLDLVAHELRQPGPDWAWYGNGKAVFDDLWAGLFVFTLISARAVDLLLRTRQQQAVAFAAGAMQWPFCESFIPSVLQQSGMNLAPVAEFADTSHLAFRPHYELDDPRTSRPGSIVHSVMGRDDLIRAEIKEQPPGDWFKPGTILHGALRTRPFEMFWPRLLERFEYAGDHAGTSAFRKEIIARGFEPPGLPDLAYCKPALVSSVSPWSRASSVEIEAGGANGAVTDWDYGFHTQEEPNAWWSVDLLDQYVIDEVAIVNRAMAPDRFRSWAVQSSRDGSAWITRFSKIDLTEVSADLEQPHRILFSDPFLARHVRIMLLGAGMLHLRRVQIFGRGLRPA